MTENSDELLHHIHHGRGRHQAEDDVEGANHQLHGTVDGGTVHTPNDLCATSILDIAQVSPEDKHALPSGKQ